MLIHINNTDVKFRKIVETCIYSKELETMKDFYVNKIGLEFVSEKGRHVFLRAGKSMLLIFNPDNTKNEENSKFPTHVGATPPACIHFALEIEKKDYDSSKKMLTNMNIDIERRWYGERE